MEIVDTNKSYLNLLNSQCRSALKCMMGLSKHCSNDLIKYYNLLNTSNLIENRKINFINQLMKNATTKSYFINLLGNPHRSYSIIQEILDICFKRNIDVIHLILQPNRKYKLDNSDENFLDPTIHQKLKNLLQNWNVYENRKELKQLLNRFIP